MSTPASMSNFVVRNGLIVGNVNGRRARRQTDARLEGGSAMVMNSHGHARTSATAAPLEVRNGVVTRRFASWMSAHERTRELRQVRLPWRGFSLPDEVGAHGSWTVEQTRPPP